MEFKLNLLSSPLVECSWDGDKERVGRRGRLGVRAYFWTAAQ